MIISSCQEEVKIYISTRCLWMVCCFNKDRSRGKKKEILPFFSPRAHTQTIRQETDRHRCAAATATRPRLCLHHRRVAAAAAAAAAVASAIDVVITQLRRRRRQRLPVEPMILASETINSIMARLLSNDLTSGELSSPPPFSATIRLSSSFPLSFLSFPLLLRIGFTT